MREHIHVGVCVPSTGEWVDDFGRSLALVCSYFAQNRVGGCKSQKLSLLTSAGSMLVYLRHKLTVSAIQAGCTHILYLDSDMAFPMELLNKMLLREKAALMLNCTTRHDPIKPTCFDMKEQRLDSRKKFGCQKISHGGLAVTLMETDAVKLLTPPLFMMDWIPGMNAYCGEDVYFCMKLQEVGVQMWTDHELSQQIKHVGRKVFGHEDVTHDFRIDDN